jgi:hypothetical protein
MRAIVVVISLTALGCARPARVSHERTCAYPKPSQQILIDSAGATQGRIVIEVWNGEHPLQDATVLLRSIDHRDTLLLARSGYAAVAAPDSLTRFELLTRRIAYFPRWDTIAFSPRGLHATVTIDRMPSHWCGLGEVVKP